MASSLWGRRDVPFLPGFLDLLAANYGAGLRVLDLAGNDESARMTINDWARQKTAGRITDLLPMGAVQGDTVLVLTNAIYFRASWQTPFDETATAPAPFHRLDGSTQDVPTMRLTAVLRQASTPDYDAVSLPYAGGKLSMLVAAARPGRFDALDGPLAPDTLAAVESALRPANVALRFPKLSFSAAFSLAEELAALGMPLAFSDGADFSGMNGAGGLKLTDVVHKAFISVDEKGTEAAAASGVVVGPTSLPPPPIDLWIDRPFIFVVRDEPTRTILFLGRFADPPR
jgi:serpin B